MKFIPKCCSSLEIEGRLCLSILVVSELWSLCYFLALFVSSVFITDEIGDIMTPFTIVHPSRDANFRCVKGHFSKQFSFSHFLIPNIIRFATYSNYRF